jgi:phytoene desaturase
LKGFELPTNSFKLPTDSFQLSTIHSHKFLLLVFALPYLRQNFWIAMSPTKKAIVIGSGVAGLAAAIRLSVKGYTVTVYEKNSYPGGKLSNFEQDGFSFDAGPSLFTQPSNIKELFELAQEPMEQYFQYEAVPVACKYFFPNGKIVQAYTDVQAFAQELKEQLGEDPNNVINYLSKAEKAYNTVGNFFLEKSIHRRKSWWSKAFFPALFNSKPAYVFSNLNQYNSRSFKQAETVQIFNRFATYNGSNPYKAPGMLSMIPHLEQNEGTFYPKGGMISITNALVALAQKKGVQFHFNAAVDRIIYHAGTARGVAIGDQNIKADIIVSNMDIYFTYQKLLNNPYRSRKVLKNERSSSAIIFYWGINRNFDQLGLHNIFFSGNYPKEFEAIFKKKTISVDPTIYVNITSKMEAGQAPNGNENWFVMVNAPANTGQQWQAIQQELKKMVIAKISQQLGVNLAEHIVTERILDPIGIETSTASFMGSLYGSSSNSRFAAFKRHPNFKDTVKGLYFVGGSVHPGGGIPLCLKSAKIVAQLIEQDTQKQKNH